MNNLEQIIPHKELHIWNNLIDHGETYLVGGAVRDMLLNKIPTDFDFCTILRPSEIIELFKNTHKVNLVGKSFGVVIVDEVEIATFRKDNYSEDGELSVKYCTRIQNDLGRRDFTVNAMAMDISGNIIDPYNGMSDIENKIIRFVGNAEDRITEDPNRMLRACRFASTLEFNLHFDTFMAILENSSVCKYIAKERINKEIMKVLSTKGKSKKFWNYLNRTKLLHHFLPELCDCYGHTGGNYHPEDVYDHVIDSVDSISHKFPELRLAALFHDLGKPCAYQRNSSINFSSHDAISSDIAMYRLKELKFSTDTINFVASLAQEHMRHALYSKSNLKAFRRIKKHFSDNNINWRDFIRLRIADHNSNRGHKNYTLSEVKEIVHPWLHGIDPEIPFSVKDLELSGGDLISIFDLEKGPIVGKLQKHLLNYVVDTGNNLCWQLIIEANKYLIIQQE